MQKKVRIINVCESLLLNYNHLKGCVGECLLFASLIREIDQGRVWLLNLCTLETQAS